MAGVRVRHRGARHRLGAGAAPDHVVGPGSCALGKITRRFDAGDSDPVFFGSHRRAQAVLVPITTWEKLLAHAEDELHLHLTSPDGVSSSAAPGWVRTSLTLRSRGQPRRRPGMLHVRHPSARTHRSPVLAELSRVLRVALAGQAWSGSNPRSISEAKRRRSSSPIIPAASLSSRSPTISPSGWPPRVSNSFPMLAR